MGLKIEKSNSGTKRKLYLLLSLVANLGILAFFKYSNFFIENFINGFTFLGIRPNIKSLNLILPVGISFYTFQTLSYSIDVYKGKIKATKDLISFFTFVSFFPQLVAGPIERAKNLLPQFHSKRKFEYNTAVDGMRQILWGLFKKVVIADQCAVIVNDIFLNYQDQSGSMLFLGGVFFAFQIYGDFSGYSDMAIGVAKLLGFKLMTNFSFPYLSRDIAEFWRRWHISLSSWFRDYVYIPMGGSRGSKFIVIRNIIIIFVVSGFWHGANWTFIAWGLLNALYFVPLFLTSSNRKNTNVIAQKSFFPNFIEVSGVLLTFSLVVLSWIFFRAENISQAFYYLKIMLIENFMYHPGQILLVPVQFFQYHISWFILILMAFEWINRKKGHAFDLDNLINSSILRNVIYLFIIIIIFSQMYNETPQPFIYFQF